MQPPASFHTYQRMTIDSYDERLSYLNFESLSVHSDITCLKYVSKVLSNTDHPLARYQPQLRTTVKTHRKGLARPTSRTALCGRSLFHKYFYLI